LYYFDETSSIATQYSFQYNKRLEFDVRRGNLNNIAALDLELTTHDFGIDYKKTYHDWHFKTGANSLTQNNFASAATGVRPLIPNYNRFDFGTYAVASLNYTSDLMLDAGLRYDYSALDASKFYQKSRWIESGYDVLFPEFVMKEVGNQILTEPSFAYHNLSASIGFIKTFAENLEWYFNTSLASRNPNASELFSDGLHHSNGIIELGDLALSKEQSFKISTTLAKQWNAFSIDVNPYINYINNYMFLSPTGVELTIRGAFPVWEYEQTTARLLGVDVQSLWKISSNWQLKSAFSYINGDDLSNNEPLIDMPPMQFINTIQYSKKEWHELLLELKADVVFTQKSFPDNNFMITILDDANNPSEVLLDISTPPPGYHLLNFYSEMAFNSFYKTKTTVAFSVQNLFNTSYRDYLNRQRFFADEIGRNFQIQIKFNY
jgi:iron complex outermembrane recepter protein